jgi:uncharacterized protein (TIGR02270 family)
MTARAIRPVAWDIYEEHLDEAAFLWTQWEDALGAANYILHEVIEGPEARLLAHLDGLVLGAKPVAERLLLPALASDEPERAAAAAWALIQAEHGEDYQDAVVQAWLNGEPKLARAIVRALGLCPRLDLSRIARLWTEAPAAVFDLMSAREPTWAAARLEEALRAGEETLVAAALRALRRTPDRAWLGRVDEVLRRDLDEVKREAIVTGYVLGSAQALYACAHVELDRSPACRLPLALLATSGNETQRGIVLAATQSAARKHALWALGFAGDVAAADLLVDAMSDEKFAKVAGEAFAAITGIQLGGSLVVHGKTQGPGDDDVADDDPPPTVSPEDHLPLPAAAAVASWWQRRRSQFSTELRYCMGAPLTHSTLRAALLSASMWRREVLGLELARTTGAAPPVDMSAWAHEQASILGGGTR